MRKVDCAPGGGGAGRAARAGPSAEGRGGTSLAAGGGAVRARTYHVYPLRLPRGLARDPYRDRL